MPDVLVLENITKEFPRVIANQDVNFSLRKGTVHALLGENGAGKTTLMNCVCGLYHPTCGVIRVDGKEVSIRNGEDAGALGIGMIHQHFMLIPELTVAENVILGMKRERDFFVGIEEVEKEVGRISDAYHFGIDPKARVRTLPVGMQQRVEIIKILYRNAEILIFDEATAVLTPQEAEELFQIVVKLKKKGKSIIIITHKLEEVMKMADDVTVLRDGQVVGNLRASETNEKELATLMVGREVLFDFREKKHAQGDVKIKVEGLCFDNDHGVRKLSNVSFEVRGGEILGIAGVDGNGQIELSEVLSGMVPHKHGRIVMKGHELGKRQGGRSFRRKIAHVPQDRRSTGLILERTIMENLILSDYGKMPFSRRGILRGKALLEHGKKLIAQYGIKASGPDAPVRELSGGNQQKVILSREISRGTEILLAVQPSRGLDIGATEFVRQKLIDERDRGVAVLLISTELEEILQLSDRIAVMYRGEIMGIVDKQSADINEIGLMMAGGERGE